MRWFGLLFLLVLATAPAKQDGQVVELTGYSIWLVRHAEKRTAGDDPGLTTAGEARASNLARWLRSEGVRAIWSTDTRRTRATAQPLAEALGIEVQLYDPGDAVAMASRLKEDAVNALVVGHSNTIPELFSELCEIEVAPIADDDYERYFWVIMVSGYAGCEERNQSELFGSAQNHSR